MLPQLIQDEDIPKPFIHTLGKVIIFLTGFYILELLVIGPRFDLYIIFGALIMLTGMLAGLCTSLLILCGFPFGLLLILIGNKYHQRVLLAQQTSEDKEPKENQLIFSSVKIIVGIIIFTSLLVWFLSVLNNQGI